MHISRGGPILAVVNCRDDMGALSGRHIRIRRLLAVLPIFVAFFVAFLCGSSLASIEAASSVMQKQAANQISGSMTAMRDAPVSMPLAPSPDQGCAGTSPDCSGLGCPAIPFGWMPAGITSDRVQHWNKTLFFAAVMAARASVDQEPTLPPPRRAT